MSQLEQLESRVSALEKLLKDIDGDLKETKRLMQSVSESLNKLVDDQDQADFWRNGVDEDGQ